MVTQTGAENIMRNVAKRMLMKEVSVGLLSWKYKWAEDANQVKGEAIMRRVGLRILNKELSVCYLGWKYKYLEDANQERGEQILRRVGARLMKAELSQGYVEWVRNKENGIKDMWRRRAENYQIEINSLQLKFSLTTQSGAENIMRNVAKRMLLKDALAKLTVWKDGWLVDHKQARGERILKRVGARFRNGDVMEKVSNWRANSGVDASQLRGEAIMRRVGARMLKKDVASAWDFFVSNFKSAGLERLNSKCMDLLNDLATANGKEADLTGKVTVMMARVTSVQCAIADGARSKLRRLVESQRRWVMDSRFGMWLRNCHTDQAFERHSNAVLSPFGPPYFPRPPHRAGSTLF